MNCKVMLLFTLIYNIYVIGHINHVEMQHHGSMPPLFIAECYTVQPYIKAIPNIYIDRYRYRYPWRHAFLFMAWLIMNLRLICNYNMEQTEKHNTIKNGIYGFQRLKQYHFFQGPRGTFWLLKDQPEMVEVLLGWIAWSLLQQNRSN